jgi:hypothetical protein
MYGGGLTKLFVSVLQELTIQLQRVPVNTAGTNAVPQPLPLKVVFIEWATNVRTICFTEKAETPMAAHDVVFDSVVIHQFFKVSSGARPRLVGHDPLAVTICTLAVSIGVILLLSSHRSTFLLSCVTLRFTRKTMNRDVTFTGLIYPHATSVKAGVKVGQCGGAKGSQ